MHFVQFNMAKVLREEQQLPEAEEIYGKIVASKDSSTSWKAKGLAGLQRVRHERKKYIESAETGIKLQTEFETDTDVRGQSAVLLRETCGAADLDVEIVRRCGMALQKFVADMKRLAEVDPGNLRAQHLLDQFQR
ncbi:MAG: hypothetical protein JST93_14705 [Acidobacteria bacterium]|nr:hypothetical protein [Acidobacteriota bacterium]